MKTNKKILGIVMVIVLLLELFAPASGSPTRIVSAACEAERMERDPIERTTELDGSLYYEYSDNNISFCSQYLPDGRIQFSCYLAASKCLYEGDVLDRHALASRYNEERYLSIDILSLNRDLVLRSDLITGMNLISNDSLSQKETAPERNYNSLSDGIQDIYGSNYNDVLKMVRYMEWGNTGYYFSCYESQTNSHATPNTCWFAADIALTSIVSWALAGFTWRGALIAIVSSVVSYVVVNGVRRTLYSFTASRTDVTVTRIRKVTHAYTQYYWAGWTRKMYFFEGDYGWTSDTTEHYEYKHYDYDDISGLIDQGFQNFVNEEFGGIL